MAMVGFGFTVAVGAEEPVPVFFGGLPFTRVKTSAILLMSTAPTTMAATRPRKRDTRFFGVEMLSLRRMPDTIAGRSLAC